MQGLGKIYKGSIKIMEKNTETTIVSYIGILFSYSLPTTIKNPRYSLGRLGKIRACKRMHVITSDNACALAQGFRSWGDS